MKTLLCAAAAALAMSGAPALADWTLVGESSKIAFGSIKKEQIGEVHHFGSISGGVAKDGTAKIEIDVTSVETLIDIRNERMLKHVFDAVNFPKAMITAQIDMDDVSTLKPGESKIVDTDATLSLAGEELEVFAELFVIAITDKKVLVTTNEMLIIATEDIGIDQGVDELMEIAQLPSITRATPVTLRLMLEKQ